MTSGIKFLFLILIFLLNGTGVTCQPAAESLVKSDFVNPPPTVKIHTWWHWVDGAISKDGISKDLESMHLQGISQATIVSVGLFNGKDFGIPRVPINSPEWNSMFRWALLEANRLGITIGIENCDGWSSSGGPWITPEMSMKQYVWTKTVVEGGKPIRLPLKQPMANLNFYRDVAVVACKTNSTNNSFRKANPKITVNDSIGGGILSDGDPVSGFDMRRGDFITLNFNHEFSAGKLAIYIRRPFMWRNMAIFNSEFALSVSDDGRNYKKAQDFEIIGLNKLEIISLTNLKSRFYKIQLCDFSNVDPQYEFTVSEVELLGESDHPTYSSGIPSLLEKTASLKTLEKGSFDAMETTTSEKFIPNETLMNLQTQKARYKSMRVPHGSII